MVANAPLRYTALLIQSTAQYRTYRTPSPISSTLGAKRPQIISEELLCPVKNHLQCRQSPNANIRDSTRMRRHLCVCVHRYRRRATAVGHRLLRRDQVRRRSKLDEVRDSPIRVICPPRARHVLSPAQLSGPIFRQVWRLPLLNVAHQTSRLPQPTRTAPPRSPQTTCWRRA